MEYNLAQVNIAQTRFAFDDPRMSGMTGRIAEINRLAENFPGFVWRFQDADAGENDLQLFSDYLAPFDLKTFFFNMSVWESVEALRNYVFRTVHVKLFERRDEWMTPLKQPQLALWWIARGHKPTVRESKEKLLHIAQHGPAAEAFTFSQLFPKPQK